MIPNFDKSAETPPKATVSILPTLAVIIRAKSVEVPDRVKVTPLTIELFKFVAAVYVSISALLAE